MDAIVSALVPDRLKRTRNPASQSEKRCPSGFASLESQLTHEPVFRGWAADLPTAGPFAAQPKAASAVINTAAFTAKSSLIFLIQTDPRKNSIGKRVHAQLI
jgi:hypothetical protein